MTPEALRRFARNWLPPAIVRLIAPLIRPGIRFEGPFADWRSASTSTSGYDSAAIHEATLAAGLAVQRGEALYERDSVLFHQQQLEWPLLSALLRTAIRRQGSLRVLDFGGSLGSVYFQHRKFLACVPALRWSVVEQPHFCATGQRHFQDETLHFFASIADCIEATGGVDLVLLSASLQYLERPWERLQELLMLGADSVVIDRCIFNTGAEDRAWVQHVPPSIYRATYPCWSLSERKLVALVAASYRVDTAFSCVEFPALASTASEFKGYLLTRRDSA